MEETKRDAALEELVKDTGLADFDVSGYDTADELIEHLETCISEEEIIYYSNAMEYLSENDSSLCQSLQLAEENGYSWKRD